MLHSYCTHGLYLFTESIKRPALCQLLQREKIYFIVILYFS